MKKVIFEMHVHVHDYVKIYVRIMNLKKRNSTENTKVLLHVKYSLQVAHYLDFNSGIYHTLIRHREIMLVADALRLGGAILMHHPQMLAPQLIGRLLPEIGSNPNVRRLLKQCDDEGIEHCALVPCYHCLHTPGGPLKV
jgi:hypothetical protein